MSCLVEHEGCTIPDNHIHPVVWYPAEGSEVPGYSITEEALQKSKAFEERCLELCRDSVRGERTFESYAYELAEARSRNDVPAVLLLQNQFNKAHNSVYGYVPIDTSGYYCDEARDYISDVLTHTGRFTVES